MFGEEPTVASTQLELARPTFKVWSVMVCLAEQEIAVVSWIARQRYASSRCGEEGAR